MAICFGYDTRQPNEYPGMDVLPTFAVYGTGRIGADGVAAAEQAWTNRLSGLFQDCPIRFRPQNGGDFPDRHVQASLPTLMTVRRLF